MATTIFAAVETGRRARLTALFSAQLLSLVVLLALPLGPWASPAMATTSNLITTNNGVLWNGCPKHAFTAYINNPYGAYGWTLDLKILDPTGRVTKSCPRLLIRSSTARPVAKSADPGFTAGPWDDTSFPSSAEGPRKDTARQSRRR
jgi:hypothetical protein